MPKIEVKELPQVNADPDLLQRVFANLIGNAIKFTVDSKSGGIKVGGYRMNWPPKSGRHEVCYF